MKFLTFLWRWLVSAVQSVGRYVIRYPLAAAATVAVVLVAVACLVSGKTLQVGGILDKIWGRKKETVRGVPPAERKDESGNIIPPGVSDEGGWVQAPVTTTIVEPGILSNPSQLIIEHPDKGKVVVELPEGVKNSDVREVVEVTPDVYEVRNKDSGVSPKKLDDLIKKVGG